MKLMSSNITGERRCPRELSDTMRAPPAAVERVVQSAGQSEVAQMVGGELQLPTLCRQLEVRQRHHAGVVDEQMERSTPARGEGGDRRLVREVEPADVECIVARGGGDVGGTSVSGGGIARPRA